MFHNNPTKSDCSKKQTKKFKPFKGKINFFTERRSFHLNFFQTGNKNFSKNFNFFFWSKCIYICWITASTWGNPTQLQAPPSHPPHLGGPLASPQTSGCNPNTNHSQILGIQTATQALTAANPPHFPFYVIFAPSPRFKAGRHISPVPPRTDYTGCGFQFYIVWPFLALITLIN